MAELALLWEPQLFAFPDLYPCNAKDSLMWLQNAIYFFVFDKLFCSGQY